MTGSNTAHPSPFPLELLNDLGVFVSQSVLPEELCARLCAEMKKDDTAFAALVLKKDDQYIVDETIRKTFQVSVSKVLSQLVLEQLQKRLPELSEFFNLELCIEEDPAYLFYKEGGYYRAHRDSSTHETAADFALRRRVSVVLFCNNQSAAHAPGSYGGGELVLYELFNDQRAEGIGIPIQGNTGMLVAFRSEQLHSVHPVTHGERFTIVYWLAEKAPA